MTSAQIKSSVIASALGVALIAAALTASTSVVPNEVGKKGAIRVAGLPLCEAGDCRNDEARLGGYTTFSRHDTENGLTTLVRTRSAD